MRRGECNMNTKKCAMNAYCVFLSEFQQQSGKFCSADASISVRVEALEDCANVLARHDVLGFRDEARLCQQFQTRVRSVMRVVLLLLFFGATILVAVTC